MGVLAAGLAALLFQVVVLRALRHAAPIVRVIATIGLLGLLQALVLNRYGVNNQPTPYFLPHDVYTWGGVVVQQEKLIVIGISIVVTIALWAWTRFARVGLAITASAQNERAVQTLGWSPDRLAALTWTLGGMLGGLAAVLVAPSAGLSPVTFTITATVAGLGAALLGAFQSFPLTLLGGLIIGVGEQMATLYRTDISDFFRQTQMTGLEKLPAFLVILFVVVIGGRGLPLRSHVTSRLPRLGSGRISVPGILLGSGVLLVILYTVMNDEWARATSMSLAGGVMLLSIIVLTGYAGQISLAQWALAGIGALGAGRLVHAGITPELAIPFGVLVAILVGLLFAIPALRTRGVNLAVVTLALGYLVSQVVLGNPQYLGTKLDGGTKIGLIKIFGFEVDATNHPQAWATVCLVAFVLLCLVVANLRRSRTGRRLIAVRTNERAAASLGISVFGVKLFAFAFAASLAAVAGILVAFRATTITYAADFAPFNSINSVGLAVIGGLGFVLGSVFGAVMQPGGLGTRGMTDWLSLTDYWDLIIGAVLMFVILIFHQNGVADVATAHGRKFWETLRLASRPTARGPLPAADVVPVAGATLAVEGLTVRFGSVVAVDGVSLSVAPGEVVGLIGPNGAGKTTLIDAVTGFVRASGGAIALDGRRIERLNATKRARLGIRRSFQSLELFEDVSVEENIRAGTDQDASRLSWFGDLFWPGKHPLPPTAVAAVQAFDLEPHLHETPENLPYGTRRLVGIARTVASGPSVVLLDEPAAGLDETESVELAGLIRRMADERNMGVLLVEHDVNLVMTTCDRIVVIDFGKVIAAGSPEEIRGDSAVRDAYLGQSDDVDDPTDNLVDVPVTHGPSDTSGSQEVDA